MREGHPSTTATITDNNNDQAQPAGMMINTRQDRDPCYLTADKELSQLLTMEPIDAGASIFVRGNG